MRERPTNDEDDDSGIDTKRKKSLTWKRQRRNRWTVTCSTDLWRKCRQCLAETKSLGQKEWCLLFIRLKKRDWISLVLKDKILVFPSSLVCWSYSLAVHADASCWCSSLVLVEEVLFCADTNSLSLSLSSLLMMNKKKKKKTTSWSSASSVKWKSQNYSLNHPISFDDDDNHHHDFLTSNLSLLDQKNIIFDYHQWSWFWLLFLSFLFLSFKSKERRNPLSSIWLTSVWDAFVWWVTSVHSFCLTWHVSVRFNCLRLLQNVIQSFDVIQLVLLKWVIQQYSPTVLFIHYLLFSLHIFHWFGLNNNNILLLLFF